MSNIEFLKLICKYLGLKCRYYITHASLKKVALLYLCFIVTYSHGFQLICSKARLDQCKCKEIKGYV